MYDASLPVCRQTPADRGRGGSRRTTNNLPINDWYPADEGLESQLEATFANDITTYDTRLETSHGTGYTPVDMTSQIPSLDEFLMIDGLLAFDDILSLQCQSLPEVPVAPYESLDLQTQTWCGWMRRGISMSSVTENTILHSKSSHASFIQIERPFAHHNADLGIQSLRAFPAMMLRRETFPWFIHQQSQILSNPATADLPEALSNCMSIAQMFALRTSETTPVLWRTIKVEYRRWSKEVCIMSTSCRLVLTQKMYQMSKFELLAAVQACMVYLVMCIIDPSTGKEQHSPELLLALNASTSLVSSLQQLIYKGPLPPMQTVVLPTHFQRASPGYGMLGRVDV